MSFRNDSEKSFALAWSVECTSLAKDFSLGRNDMADSMVMMYSKYGLCNRSSIKLRMTSGAD